MRRTLIICSALILFAASASAQKTKPWTEWTEKEAEKMLNNSGWGQTQTEGEAGSSAPTSTSTVTQVNAPRSSATQINREGESGESKPSMVVRCYVRFLSAKPIRAAFVRKVELQQQSPNPQLRTFVDREFGEYIVLTVSLDGNDRKRMAPIMQELMSGDVEALKTTTYLERKDGKKIVLMDYRAPSQDGLGAKFVFPRSIDGKPFIDESTGEVRFATELGKAIRINRRFKVTEMMYEGKLEY